MPGGVAGPGRRPSWPGWPPRWRGSRRRRSCWSTGWSARPRRRAGARGGAGCGWCCSCTCRSDDAGEAARAGRRPRGGHDQPVDPRAGARCRRHVATPGVDPAPLAPPSPAGDRLLCVGAVAAHKGQDRLIDALAAVPEPFTCTYVGSLTREPDFVGGACRHPARPPDPAGRRAGRTRPGRRVRGGRPAGLRLSRGDLRDGRDRGARARDPGAGGTGRRAAGSRSATPRTAACPGCWSSRTRLAGALRRWLTDADLRERLRRSAMARRTTLTGWDVTARIVSGVLAAA